MTPPPAVDQNAIRRRGVGLRAWNREKAFPGYTLFAPITGSGQVYLIDLDGTVVHQWNLPYPPGAYGYLLPNGNLLYNGKTADNIERGALVVQGRRDHRGRTRQGASCGNTAIPPTTMTAGG
jgi:hypothetical protein